MAGLERAGQQIERFGELLLEFQEPLGSLEPSTEVGAIAASAPTPSESGVMPNACWKMSVGTTAHSPEIIRNDPTVKRVPDCSSSNSTGRITTRPRVSRVSYAGTVTRVAVRV